MRLWKTSLCTLYILAFAFVGEVRAAKSDLRVVGTDLLGVDFSRAIYAHCSERGSVPALTLEGSRPGLAALEAGDADLALAVIPSEEEQTLAGYVAVTFAYSRVIVVAPAECPVTEVSLDKLESVFAEGRPIRVAWSELGASGPWAAKTIAPVAPESGAGIATEFFRHVVLHDRSFKDTTARYSDRTELARLFAEGKPALAFSSAPFDTPTTKILAVAARNGGPAFLPTPENVHSGDYPLRLPLRAVFRAESAVKVRPLVEFLLSASAAHELEVESFVALPPAARAEPVIALGKP